MGLFGSSSKLATLVSFILRPLQFILAIVIVGLYTPVLVDAKDAHKPLDVRYVSCRRCARSAC